MVLNKVDFEILDIVKSFQSFSKNKNEKYKEFLTHVYLIFDKKINLCKTSKLKNKYIQMRTNALKYIVNNQRAITAEICKKK